MSSEIAIELDNISKCYEIYDHPKDRLKQIVVPGLRQLLSLENKSYYREFWALRPLSLSIPKGQTVGIIGTNGSGKSTLLQIICGTLTPTQGSVKTKGRIGALLELGAGFNPEFTGRENVYLNATILGLTEKEINSRFADIEKFADIGSFIDQPVKTYSSGMYVRLAFSVIAHIDAELLIIDEALAVGDVFFTQKCMRFLHDFVKRGSIVFVSHDTAAVRALCSRAVWVDKGLIRMDGLPKDVCNGYLKAFYQQEEGDLSRDALRKPPFGDDETSAAIVKGNEIPIDGRLRFINSTNLRNDLEIFSFAPTDTFGQRGAEIVNVKILDEGGASLAWTVGGEAVALHIEAKANVLLTSPIIGFMVKDRLGQTLFGDNTFLSTIEKTMVCERGASLEAVFSFRMPILPAGDYVISVAIADGTQSAHVQHHWVHDAIAIKSVSSSVATGLVGVPMERIEIRAV